MKRMALVAMLAVASTAGAQGSFEGVVTYQSENSGKPMMWTYMAKGHKVRLASDDPSAMGGGMIIDGDAHTMTMVVPQQKMYMTQTINTDKTTNDTAGRGWKITKTGSEVIAGIPCDDYTAVSPKGENEGPMCIAHGMGDFMSGGGNMGMGMGRSAWGGMAARVPGLSQAMSGGFFPLKMTKNGKTEMIATKVERKSVDASQFAPPTDYKEMKMPMMPQKP
jgi:hypothetical protein